MKPPRGLVFEFDQPSYWWRAIFVWICCLGWTWCPSSVSHLIPILRPPSQRYSLGTSSCSRVYGSYPCSTLVERKLGVSVQLRRSFFINLTRNLYLQKFPPETNQSVCIHDPFEIIFCLADCKCILQVLPVPYVFWLLVIYCTDSNYFFFLFDNTVAAEGIQAPSEWNSAVR